MREECTHFQSRTYASGEVARFCVLDLAPEAPWRCPDDCPSYQRRMADVGWEHGSLVEPAVEEEPEVPSGEAIAVLGQAEEIVGEVSEDVLADVLREDAARRAEEARRRKWSGRRPWRKR